MVEVEQRRKELLRMSPRLLVEECHRVAPWQYPTEKTARHLLVEAVIAAEYGAMAP